MTGFDKLLLHFFVRDALSGYSEDFLMLEGGNPCRCRLNGRTYAIHVSYIHDSGENRANDDEVRIQISRAMIDQQRTAMEVGERVAFIGFFVGGKVFVAWDPIHVLSQTPEKVGSVYARASMAQTTLTTGAEVRGFNSPKTGMSHVTISLGSEVLGLYLENIESVHKLHSAADLIHLLSIAGKGLAPIEETPPTTSIHDVVEVERERFEYTRVAFKRSSAFRAATLSAYRNACCVCGNQLGLVEAAHIVPHAAEESTDAITNGLAMCANHHRLYDNALLLPGPGNKLFFNELRARFLRETGRGGGLEEVRAFHDKDFALPDDRVNHPDSEFLRLGFEMRTA